tara:strand:+ start:229 stop:918 length:690 start_codon:yes stop_codon:yes gene_type:complete
MRGGALGFVPLLALLLALPEEVSGRVPSLGSLRQLEGQLEALEAEVVDEALERRREKVLHVVVSTAQYTPLPDSSKPPGPDNSGEDIMSYVEAVAKKRNDLIFSYDWKGSVTTSEQHSGSKDAGMSDADWHDPKKLEASWWYHGFKMAFLEQIKVFSELGYDRVDLIGIKPGPDNAITKLEQAQIPLMVMQGHAMMKSKGVKVGLREADGHVIKFRPLSFDDFKTEFPK